MHIDLQPNASLVHKRSYPVPQVHLATFKRELDHLVEIGVLSPARDTERGLPTFISPKKCHSKMGFLFKRTKQGSQEKISIPYQLLQTF